MANLLIDIGNSNCKVSVEQGGELGEIFKSSEQDILSFVLSVIKNETFDVIVLSTVREDDLQMQQELEKFCNKLVVLSTKTKLPDGFELGYDAVGLGADRLAAAIAVAKLFPERDCIKFDFGTALTVDFITKEGVYKGGNISLGLQSRFRALNTFTKRLPLLKPTDDFKEIGTKTTEAMMAGVVLGLIFEVEGYINKNLNHTVIFTGGDSFYFAKKIKSPIFVVQNLVLIGLAQIANYYAKNQRG